MGLKELNPFLKNFYIVKRILKLYLNYNSDSLLCHLDKHYLLHDNRDILRTIMIVTLSTFAIL